MDTEAGFYFQGIGVGLAAGFFAGWWLEGVFMFGVAALGLGFVALGHIIRADANTHSIK